MRGFHSTPILLQNEVCGYALPLIQPLLTFLDVEEVRPATRKAWVKQGLPEDLDAKNCSIRLVNITSFPSEGFEWEPSPSAINLGPIPPFEYKIIREDERYRI